MISPFLLLAVLTLPAVVAWMIAWVIGDGLSRY
jgi:hypothetical protein